MEASNKTVQERAEKTNQAAAGRTTKVVCELQMPDLPAFTVGLATETTTFTLHEIIKFDHVVTNVGNCYNVNSGKFIAPYSGVYVFNLVAMQSSGRKMYLEIMKDGHSVTDFLVDASNFTGYLSQSKMWVLELVKNSEVWIRANTASALHGGNHTQLSGWMLR